MVSTRESHRPPLTDRLQLNTESSWTGWEMGTCSNEIDQQSARCQHNSSKFLSSLHEHTKREPQRALTELARLPTRSTSMEMSRPPFHHDDANHEPNPQHMPDETVTFSFRMTNAKVVGLSDSPNVARHLVPRSLTPVCGSSGFVTSPPSCTKSTRFIRHCFRTRRSTMSRLWLVCQRPDLSAATNPLMLHQPFAHHASERSLRNLRKN